MQSVTHDVEVDGSETVGRVGTNLVYGKWLEMGTTKMSPRRWLKPSLAINRDKINKLILNAVKGKDVDIDIGME